jgi:hypothetical protein
MLDCPDLKDESHDVFGKYTNIKMTNYPVETLEYDYENGSHVIFSKYTIDALGIIKNKKSGDVPSYGNATYNRCGVYDDEGKYRMILVGRAVASTFLGKPPTSEHTADHIVSDQKKNDALSNIRWLCKKGQVNNRIMPKTLKSAFIVVKDGVEKTVNEWVAHMNDIMPKDRKFTRSMIEKYATRKQRGFAYKEYPDLNGEVWKPIKVSKTKSGDCWKISNMNRVKFITNTGTENVLWGKRLGRLNGYPVVSINGNQWKCHILAFEAFNPTVKRGNMMVLHEDDDKEDFRPHKLRLGTHSDNGKDSHDNGNRDGTKSARMKCASYINGVHEEDHDSQHHAVKYLKTNGYTKASSGGIRMALSGKYKSAYGRTWKKIL